MVRHDVFVVSTPVSEGERFAILRPEQMLVGPLPLPVSLEDWRRAFDNFLRSVALLSEDELRTQLAEMGFRHDDVEDQIGRARNLHNFNGEVAWEYTTNLGYRNRYGQEVVRKTGLTGTRPYQRVYVLRCGECSHEYGAEGCDIHNHPCPRCQGGGPSLPVTSIA